MRPEGRYRAVCFDMDGTLLDTAIDYEKLGNAEAFVLSNLGVPESVISRYPNDIDLIRNGTEYLNRNGNPITFDEVCELVNKRASDVEMESVDTARCFPGVKELLGDLRMKGYRIGLLTRGQRLYAETVMGKCGILEDMDAIEAFDDRPTGEQKPNPIAMEYLARKLDVFCKEILYVGDSVWDYYCARDSGAGFVGIAAGEGGRLKWERINEKVPTIDDIVGVVDYL